MLILAILLSIVLFKELVFTKYFSTIFSSKLNPSNLIKMQAKNSRQLIENQVHSQLCNAKFWANHYLIVYLQMSDFSF